TCRNSSVLVDTGCGVWSVATVADGAQDFAGRPPPAGSPKSPTSPPGLASCTSRSPVTCSPATLSLEGEDVATFNATGAPRQLFPRISSATRPPGAGHGPNSASGTTATSSR